MSARLQFDVQHTPGVRNNAADALSCNELSSFRTQVPKHPGGYAVGALLQSADLDIAGLDSMVQLLLHALTQSTQRYYSSAQARYMSFCATYHIQPLPIVWETLCKFAAWLADQGVSHFSIKCPCATCKSWQGARTRALLGCPFFTWYFRVSSASRPWGRRINRALGSRLQPA